MKFGLIIFAIIFLVTGLVGFYFYLDHYDPGVPDKNPFDDDGNYNKEFFDETVVEDGSRETDVAIERGLITGSLGYPSDFIPELEICAIEVDNEDSFCTYEMLEGDIYSSGFGYELNVPEGRYHVYAEVNEEISGDLSDYKAYYSEFVTCGQEFSCPSHEPIIVEVQSDQTVAEVDPVDWYR